MAETLTYTVPDMSCAHCERAIRSEILALPGVDAVEVDLAAKRVAASGAGLDDAALRAAIAEAGYQVA